MGNTPLTTTCLQPPVANEKVRLPWALTQAERFESEDCPFCSLRRSHCAWLRTEIKRFNSEVASIETTIPPRFIPDLERRLQELPLPESAYTGGVDDIRGSACPRCTDHRREVRRLQKEARALDSQCKARIEFHRRFARRIEALLIDKRQVEAQLFFGQQNSRGSKQAQSLDGQLCAITKVNQSDGDAFLSGGLDSPDDTLSESALALDRHAWQ